uniref:Carboxylesterase type B domain-containing protein n=1 Tax=Setaria digitata TaxID=48799 RepID=A0A915PK61_9BILA
MRIEHILLLHLLYATFGSTDVGGPITRNELFDVEASTTTDDALPLRKTTHGEILGYYVESDGILAEVFEAVPYAQPPIGSLRFETTKTLIGWNGTRYCGRGRIVRCVQFGRYSREEDAGTEDCLYATIVIPHKQATGSANVSPIETIIRNFASRGIIFAAINYRLGPLGFLTASHRELHGNYGLDDQIEAIRWIRTNARNLGGELNNIVVGGVGAGAACASLFNGVILRSGSSIAPWAVRSASTENYSARLIDYCGCDYNRTLGMSHTVRCLKTVPVERLQKAWKHIARLVGDQNHFMGTTYFTPITDPYRIEASVLPGDPMSVMLQNPRMPLLIGVTNREITQIPNISILKINRYLQNGYWDLSYVIPSHLHSNYKQVQKAVEYQYLNDYPQNLDEVEQSNVIVNILSDQYFTAPAAREALLYAKKNRTVYAYIFEYENTQLSASTNKNEIRPGASHGSDCSFIFNNPLLSGSSLKAVNWNDDDRKIIQRLVSQMANFIHRRNLSEIGFKRFTTICRVATLINREDLKTQVEFFSNVTGFWHEIIPAIEQLRTETQYRVLLQPCTMCQYPYKVPFYIILTVLILVTIGLLSVCVHRQQRVKQKPTYAIVHELQTLKNDKKLKMELSKMP